jgi:hypothetical protein
VQQILTRLDPEIAAADVKRILNASSNARAETGFVGNVGEKNQGKADGDSLENVVNALGSYLGVDTHPEWVELKGNLDGGSWANIEGQGRFTGRSDLQMNLSLIAQHPNFRNVVGNVVVANAASTVAETAKTDFGALVALETLSPFFFKSLSDEGSEARLAELWTSAWPDELAAWNADKAERAQGRNAITYTDNWIFRSLGYVVGYQPEKCPECTGSHGPIQYRLCRRRKLDDCCSALGWHWRERAGKQGDVRG